MYALLPFTELTRLKQRKFDDADLYRRSDYDNSISAISTQPMPDPCSVQQEEDVKPVVKGLPPHMRALVQRAARSPLSEKGKTPSTPSSFNIGTSLTGLSTPVQSPANAAMQTRTAPPHLVPQQSTPSRPPHALQSRPQAAPPSHPRTAQQAQPHPVPITHPSVATQKQAQSAQPMFERKVTFKPVSSPPRRGPSQPQLKADLSDDLDAFFGSDDDAFLAAYDGVGTEASAQGAAQPKQRSTLSSSTTANANSSRPSPRPPSQPSGGFRFPPDFPAVRLFTRSGVPLSMVCGAYAYRPQNAAASGSSSRAMGQDTLSVVGVKRPAEVMQQPFVDLSRHVTRAKNLPAFLQTYQASH
jgi:hypothetical protein